MGSSQPDMSLPDFSLQGFLKDSAYTDDPRTTVALRGRSPKKSEQLFERNVCRITDNLSPSANLLTESAATFNFLTV